MRILHLFSNRKLTGPAEPALNLCMALRRKGYDVSFACSGTGDDKANRVAERARELGFEPITPFKLNKHFHPFDNLRDLRTMPAFLDTCEIDILHSHMVNDHLLGGVSARLCERPILVIRSSYGGGGLGPSLRNRLLLKRYTDALITPSRISMQRDLARFKLPAENVWHIDVPVDTERFDPCRNFPDMRPRFSIHKTDFVVGIVARVQWHRRFDVLLQAVAIAVRKLSTLRLLIVGRGTNIRKIAVEPSRKMGLSNNVVFAGYQSGDDYVATLACMDAKIYLVPGTDGSCRAVREAMAMAKPVIATRRGMLPELVDDGVTGIVVEDTPESLADAMLKLASDPSLCMDMGQAGHRKAQCKFSLDTQATEVGSVYETLLARRGAVLAKS